MLRKCRASHYVGEADIALAVGDRDLSCAMIALAYVAFDACGPCCECMALARRFCGEDEAEAHVEEI
jgi:hypothetical protein